MYFKTPEFYFLLIRGTTTFMTQGEGKFVLIILRETLLPVWVNIENCMQALL